MLVAHACTPTYSGGRDQEDHSSKPAWANSSRGPISKKKKERKKKRKKSQKRAGGAAQGTDTKFKPQYFKKKKGMNNQKLSLRVVVQIQPTIWSRKS
jgi:hypothetical protein